MKSLIGIYIKLLTSINSDDCIIYSYLDDANNQLGVYSVQNDCYYSKFRLSKLAISHMH